MANFQTQKLSGFLKGGLEQAQARFATFEEGAQRVVQDLLSKRQDLLAGDYVKEISGRARHVGADVAARLEELRERAIAAAGVASREQVDELQRDLDKLSRKLDKLLSLNAAKKVGKDHKAV